MDYTRKEFLTVLGALSGSALLGCGSSNSSTDMGIQHCDSNIQLNHGHVLNLSPAQVAAGAASSTNTNYDIMGTADHTHTVTLTPAQHVALEAASPANVTSTMTNSATYGLHDHMVTVTCA